MREITLSQTDDGFIVQGLSLGAGEEREWNDPNAHLEKETFHLREDDLSRFVDEALSRREGRSPAAHGAHAHGLVPNGFYESALRVIGGYVDEQMPRDIFFFEQDHQFVMRLLMHTRAGLRHVLVEFTRDDIEQMIASAQERRGR
jgi:hypothetical protein